MPVLRCGGLCLRVNELLLVRRGNGLRVVKSLRRIRMLGSGYRQRNAEQRDRSGSRDGQPTGKSRHSSIKAAESQLTVNPAQIRHVLW